MNTSWKPEEEEKLQELYRERKRSSPTGQMWEPISLRLQKLGINRTSRECKLKYYSFLAKRRRQEKANKQKRNTRSQSQKLSLKSLNLKAPGAHAEKESDVTFELIQGVAVKQNINASVEELMPQCASENYHIYDATGNVLQGLYYYEGNQPGNHENEREECLPSYPESDVLLIQEHDLSYLHF